MKKLFAILLTLAMALSLAACGGNSGEKDGGAPADGESQQQEPADTTPADTTGGDEGNFTALHLLASSHVQINIPKQPHHWVPLVFKQ